MTKLRFALPLTILLLAPAAVLAGDAAGKDTFIEKGCNKCHGVTSASIEAKIKSEKMQGPDLDGVGSRYDAEFITKFVLEEAQLNDKNHKGSWDGTESELKAIVDWLASLKEE